MHTTLAAIAAPNANPYNETPSRSSAAAGIAVATARYTNEISHVSEMVPMVVARQWRSSSRDGPVSVSMLAW